MKLSLDDIVFVYKGSSRYRTQIIVPYRMNFKKKVLGASLIVQHEDGKKSSYAVEHIPFSDVEAFHKSQVPKILFGDKNA